MVLVIRRKVNQGFLCFLEGRQIRISLLAIEGDRVKLGVEAPPDVIVLREELVAQQEALGVVPPVRKEQEEC